jgi:hypothetical protein
MVKSGNDVEQRRLSATARAEDGEKLVVADLKIDAVQGYDAFVPRDIGELFAQSAYDDARMLLPKLSG